MNENNFKTFLASLWVRLNIQIISRVLRSLFPLRHLKNKYYLQNKSKKHRETRSKWVFSLVHGSNNRQL